MAKTMFKTTQTCLTRQSQCDLQSQKDLEAVWTILTQLCKAYRNDGGRTIVIMSQQPKLDMEATFRRTIPKNQRFGSTFVFRQVLARAGNASLWRDQQPSCNTWHNMLPMHRVVQ